ncbi:MAG TPA: hypothetical protein VJB90_02260 [Candidatus Nanoarchaeia archaeon]|nr:hypothetical protein [Candidatus Nanoarchaeia archaeon]
MAKAQNKDEEVGFHKGSLATLAKERQELMRILGIVEQLMQLHAAELQKLGVDLSEAKKGESSKGTGKKKRIDDML